MKLTPRGLLRGSSIVIAGIATVMLAAPHLDIFADTAEGPAPADARSASLPDPSDAPEQTAGLAPELRLLAGADGPCAARLDLAAGVDALIELSLDAPCAGSQRVVIRHAALEFTVHLDDAGRFFTFLPALAQDADVEVTLADGHALSGNVQVPEAGQHARTVLHWQGPAGFALHAFHGAAERDSPGHLSAERPFDMEIDESFLIALGDGQGEMAQRVHVHSIPTRLRDAARVALMLDFDAQTCGRAFSARIFQSVYPEGGGLQEAEISAPGCDTASGFVLFDLPAGSAPLMARDLETPGSLTLLR